VIKRGQIIIIALQGDYGKPRPAVVVQSDLFREHPSIIVCPLTSFLRADSDTYRVDVMPSPENGLQERSQVSIDKLTAVPASKIGKIVGELDKDTMDEVTGLIAVFLGIA
jgi:mRNA interferase MazF